MVPPSGRQIELVHGEQRAVVVELGAALRSYTVGSRPRVDGYEIDEMCSGSRGQVLLPWPNRIAGGAYEFDGARHQLALDEPARHNAIHGLLRWSAWRIEAVEPARATFAHTLLPRPGYPFTLELEVRYELQDAGLEVAVRATNAGAGACPYGAGFHPYLRLDPDHIDGLELLNPASVYYRADDDMIPIGRESVAGTEFDFRTPRVIGTTRMDTAFTDLARTDDGRCVVALRDPASGGTVSMWCDASFDYLMVFTGDGLPDAERRRTGLAVEPMTCAPDAFRSGDGLRVLDPGESASGRWGITATRGGS